MPSRIFLGEQMPVVLLSAKQKSHLHAPKQVEGVACGGRHWRAVAKGVSGVMDAVGVKDGDVDLKCEYSQDRVSMRVQTSFELCSSFYRNLIFLRMMKMIDCYLL
jgi:hypothetical protein